MYMTAVSRRIGASVLRAWRRPAARGFTLIEIMIALTLLAILSMLAVPAFNTWIANSRVRIAGSDLADGLRLAQTESLRRNRQTVFALTASNDPAAGYAAAANGSNWAVSVVPSTLNPSPVFVRAGNIADFQQHVSIEGPAAICFSTLGRIVTNGNIGIGGTSASCQQPGDPPAVIYQVTMTGADHPLQVEVGLGGQVRLCNPAQAVSASAPEGCQFLVGHVNTGA